MIWFRFMKWFKSAMKKKKVLFWIIFIAGKTTYVKYLIFSNSVQIWYDFQSHRTMRPQMQIFAHRAKQCAVCVLLANNILTFWPLTLRLPPHQLHLWYLSSKKISPLTFSHKRPLSHISTVPIWTLHTLVLCNLSSISSRCSSAQDQPPD